jgi:prepilin-type N-terminal cleavage/methylation domain-containing protein
MIHRITPARPGLTLIEVLVALFILGIGMMAILVLFPLGLLSMKRAIAEDRAANAAANAAALATALSYRTDPNVLAALNTSPVVYLDPWYASLTNGSTLPSGAPAPTPNIPRVTLSSQTLTPALTAQLFAVQDDLSFDPAGLPLGSSAAGASVLRKQNFTWAYLIRRPGSLSWTQPTSSSPSGVSQQMLPEVTVVVYLNRITSTISGEVAYSATSSATATNAAANTPVSNFTLTWSGTKPNLRKGSWVLDTVNGYFYQVSSSVDIGSGSINVELESNLRTNVSNVIVMDNVIAVLERGSTWKP